MLLAAVASVYTCLRSRWRRTFRARILGGHFMHSFVKCLFQDMPPILLKIGSYLTDTKQKKFARFLRHHVLLLLWFPTAPSPVLWFTDVRRAHNTYGDRCFDTAGPRVWNFLPSELQSCDSLRQFKRCLKTFLFGSWDYGALWRSRAPYRNSLTYLLTYLLIDVVVLYVSESVQKHDDYDENVHLNGQGGDNSMEMWTRLKIILFMQLLCIAATYSISYHMRYY